MRGVDTLRRAATAAQAVLGDTESRFDAIEEVLGRSTADSAFFGRVHALRARLYDARQALEGDALKQRIGEPTAPAILGRIGTIDIGARFSTYGPTPHHERNYEIAVKAFDALRTDLDSLLSDLASLESDLDAAGVAWTPGRAIPQH